MPYRNNSELPKAVQDNYTDRCQTVFRNAFNSDLKRNKTESRAFAVANVAAKNCMESTTKDKRQMNKSEEETISADDSEAEISKAESSISVPNYVSANARRGLKLYEEGKGGDGLVAATIAGARDMVRGSITEEKLRKIGPWIARHIIDLDAPKNSNPNAPGYPGAGLVAMLLWGAGPDKGGARRTMDWANAKVEQLDKRK